MRTNFNTIATMKNLFKSLMLVAVAAMAFTACQNEPEGVRNTLKKATLNVEASLDQTRSSFVDEADAEAIKTVWDGNETIGFHINNQPEGEGVSQEYTYLYTDVKLTEGGEKANFVVEFELTGDETMPAEGVLRACSPYVQGKIEPTYSGFNLNVPAEQTPEVNDVDAAAQILYAEYNGEFTENLTLALPFKHYAAYGKMTIKGGVEAESVVVKIDRKEYTLSSENVENGLYWFACEECKTPEAVKVTINGTDGKSYSKELDLTKNTGFGFTAGRLSVFTVDMTGVEAGGDEEQVDFVLTSWSAGTEVTPQGSSEKAYQYRAKDANGNYLDVRVNNKYSTATSIEPGTYTFNGYVEGKTFGIGKAQIDGTIKYSSSFSGGELTVAVENDVYVINIAFVADGNNYTARFVGVDGITLGGSQPADPVKLDTPEPQVTAVTTNSITVSWSADANATGYKVQCGNAETTVTETSVTFTDLQPDTEYMIFVTALGNDANYINSDAGSVIVRTEAEQGSGEDVGGVYDPWECTVKLGGLNGNGYNVTLTGTGANTDVIEIEAVPIANAGSYVVAKRGNETGSGTARIDDESYQVVFDITIGDTTYRGTSSNAVI